MNRESRPAGTFDTRPELTPDFGDPVLPPPPANEECEHCGEPLHECLRRSPQECPEYKYAREND